MSDYAEVPQKLKDLPNWVVWQLPSKKPFDPKNPKVGAKVGAKADDPTTWASFDVACNVALLNSFDGIGFEFRGTQIVGIDFDSVLDNGGIDPFAAEILLKLGNPYCEISPSGRGLHAFVECTCEPPKGGRKFSDGNHFGIEIYFGQEKGRYFTITGQKYSGEGIPKLDNLDIAYFMMSQCQNIKLKKLWMGDLSDYGDDHSRADCALAWQLAQVFGRDPQKIEWAMNASKLCQREKWERADYRQRTISKAIESKVEPTEAAAVVEPEPIIREGNSIKPKRLKWLWDRRVPLGKVTLFAGNPDNGKSLGSCKLAAHVTTGYNYPDAANIFPSSDVIMLTGEDDLDDTAVPRLMAAGADMNRIHFLEGVQRSTGGTNIRLDLDRDTLGRVLDRYSNTRLVVIDPISNYLGDVSMVSEQDVREVLIPLKALAAERQIAIVIVMHLNKKSELEAISRVGGAMAFIGVARASWLFQRDEPLDDGTISEKFSMTRIKNNLAKASNSGISFTIESRDVASDDGPMVVPFIRWGTELDKSADSALAAKRDRGGHKNILKHDIKLQTAIRFLGEVLADGPRLGTEVKERAHEEYDIKPITLRRAFEELQCKAFKDDKVWRWKLPSEHEQVDPARGNSMSNEQVEFELDEHLTEGVSVG